MILVTGATGTVGSEVVKQLVDKDIDFRAVVHQNEKSDLLNHPNVQIVHADYENPGSLRNAMDGVDHVFLLSPVSPKQVEYERHITDAAKEFGVQHLVKLSVFGASPFSPVSIVRNHWDSEKYIENSGIPFTFVRPNTFMQNILHNTKTIVSEGKIYAAMDDGSVSMIDVRDIASVCVTALRDPGYQGLTLEITGPAAVSYYDIAAAISDAVGKKVEFVDITMDQARESMSHVGVPENRINDYLAFQEFYRSSFAAATTPWVQKLTGREPISFEQFARDYAQEFSGQERMAA